MSLIIFFLRALKCPFLADFDVNDRSRYQKLVLWVENAKIRHYPATGREHLQTAEDTAWNTAMDSYLTDLRCPVAWNNGAAHVPALQWLLNHAVALEFEDRPEMYLPVINEAAEAAPSAQDWAPLPPTPFTDATSPETLAAVRRVVTALRLPLAPEEQITAAHLAKARSVLESQVLPCLAEAQRRGGKAISPAAALADIPLGFSTGDPQVDVAATVLRMLYIKDLRQLQDQVDAGIVAVQNLTADPRTDAAMGKVGR